MLAELKNTAWACASVNAAVCAAFPPRLYVATQKNRPAKCATKALPRFTEERLRTAPHLHLQLQPGNERAELVASQAKLVEELLVEAIDDGSLKLDPGSKVAGSRIVFHGHCHQKALAGTKATVELLKRVPGAEVVELDAGCCGMAGSFGFESEHYELSMQIGESRLFPALRAEGGETVVAATGVSCRQQIGHGVGREARHPVQIVREAL